MFVRISGSTGAFGQGAAADQFTQMRPEARALFEKWAKQQSAKDGKATDARGRLNGKVFHHAIPFALPADFPFLKHVVENAIRQHKMSYYTVSNKSILLGKE
ncbi:MAG: hypothetical protein AAB288_05720 [Acidobacteriota bacterium]